jgi:hypothetical protein
MLKIFFGLGTSTPVEKEVPISTKKSKSQPHVVSVDSKPVEKKKRKRSNKKKPKTTSNITNNRDDNDDSDSDSDDDILIQKVNEVVDSEVKESLINEYKYNRIDVNPVDVTISEVLTLASKRDVTFQSDDVRGCISSMYDKGLGYDVVSDVYDECFKIQKANESSQETIIIPNKKQEKKVSNKPAPAPKPVAKVSNITGTNARGANGAGIRAMPDVVTKPKPVSHKPFVVETPPIIEHIEIKNIPPVMSFDPYDPVVNASNPDPLKALQNLNQWSVNSNAGGVVGDLFFGTSAIEIVLGTLLSDCEYMKNTEIRDELNTLLIHVLASPISNIEIALATSSAASIVYHLNSLVQQQAAVSSTPSLIGTKNLAKRISNTIRKSLTIIRSKAQVNSKKDVVFDLKSSLDKIDAEIIEISTMLTQNKKIDDKKTITDLQSQFVKRELEHDKVNFSLSALEEILFAKKTKTMVEAVTSLSIQPVINLLETNNVNNTLESALLLERGETPSSIRDKVTRGSNVATYISRLHDDTNARIVPFNDELDKCANQVSNLLKEKNDLLQKLQAIEMESIAIQGRRNKLEASIRDVYHAQEKQIAALGNSQQQQGVVNAIQLQEGVGNIMKRVIALETSLSESLEFNDSSSSDNGDDILINQFSTRMSDTSNIISSYVNSESHCIIALSRRCVLAKNQLDHLQGEVQVYKGLKMQSMVTDMEQAILKLNSNLDEDKVALNHLQNDLTKCLVRFTSTLVIGTHNSDVSIPMTTLNDIATALTEAGVSLSSELIAITKSNKRTNNTNKPSNGKQQTTSTVNQPKIEKKSSNNSNIIAISNNQDSVPVTKTKPTTEKKPVWGINQEDVKKPNNNKKDHKKGDK